MDGRVSEACELFESSLLICLRLKWFNDKEVEFVKDYFGLPVLESRGPDLNRYKAGLQPAASTTQPPRRV